MLRNPGVDPSRPALVRSTKAMTLPLPVDDQPPSPASSVASTMPLVSLSHSSRGARALAPVACVVNERKAPGWQPVRPSAWPGFGRRLLVLAALQDHCTAKVCAVPSYGSQVESNRGRSDATGRKTKARFAPSPICRVWISEMMESRGMES